MVRMITLCIMIGCGLLATNTFAASIDVRVTSKTVIFDEPFTIQFISTGEVDKAPDFTPLTDDFDISAQRQSQNISIFNGNRQAQYVWSVTVTPTKTGVVTIPQIAFGQDQSPALDITVKKIIANASADGVFIEANTDITESYVQAQIILTVKLYVVKGIGDLNMDKVTFSNDDVVVEAISEYKQTDALIKDGVRYKQFVGVFALFPQHSGPLTIEPIRFKGKYVVRSARSFFDNAQYGVKRVQTKPITLNILPARTAPWIPTSNLQVVETWSQDPPQFTVGESVTRTITLSTQGLTAAQIPALQLKPLTGAKHYPDQPETTDQTVGQSILGIRREKIAYVPTQAGTMVIPEVTIPWWNTQQKRVETAKIPARTVQVLPGAQPQPIASEPAPTLKTSATHAENLTAENVAILQNTTAAPVQNHRLWIGFFLLWLLTALAWWWHATHWRRKQKQREPQAPTTRASLAHFKQCCLAQNAKGAHQALLHWGQAQFPHPFRLTWFATQLDRAGQQEIDNLLAACYQREASPWARGEPLYQCVQQWRQPRDKRTHTGELEMLFQT